MATVERLVERGTRRGRKALATLGEEFRDKRVAIGLSQQLVADAAGISRSTYTRIEAGKLHSLSVLIANLVAAVLGLDLGMRTFPGPNALRDGAQAAHLARVLDNVGAPLTSRTEVVLPQRPDQPFEQRAWGAQVTGLGRRTAFEMEMRVHDAQATERRINLKARDDPVDNLVVLIADTHANRRVLKENPGLFPELARLTYATLTKLLRAGQHPPSCLVLVGPPPAPRSDQVRGKVRVKVAPPPGVSA